MIEWNLYAAWLAILLGFLTGSVQGLFFHRESWWGGYASWSRRTARLGHVSLFGLALINLAFAYTMSRQGLRDSVKWPSTLLISGTFLMPLACYASAWKPALRHLFFLPVLSLISAAVMILVRLFTQPWKETL